MSSKDDVDILLKVACLNGNKKRIIEILRDNEVTINSNDNKNGWTALHNAVYKNFIEIVEILVGANNLLKTLQKVSYHSILIQRTELALMQWIIQVILHYTLLLIMVIMIFVNFSLKTKVNNLHYFFLKKTILYYSICK